MQEHEYVYEYAPGLEPIQKSGSAREAGQLENLSGSELEPADNLSSAEITSVSVDTTEELEELRDQRATLRLGRGLVAGLGLSFLACLAAFWLSGTLLSAPDQIVPVDFLQMLAANRVIVLCVPVIFLVICYAALRSLTAEIMAVPESHLDERQKMLRDQAHRSAFKIVKFSSVLIPIAFILPRLPWFNPPTPAATPLGGITVFMVDGNPPGMNADGPQWHWYRNQQYAIHLVTSGTSALPIQPASSMEIALAGGLLLISLLLMFSALPKAVLAWKGKA